jgi:hypothetical protein
VLAHEISPSSHFGGDRVFNGSTITSSVLTTTTLRLFLRLATVDRLAGKSLGALFAFSTLPEARPGKGDNCP